MTDDGVAFWLARDLQNLLGYEKWDNFQNVISKAKTACDISGQNISDHFADVGKMVVLFNGFQKKTQKTPSKDIDKAIKLKDEYFKTKKK